MTARILPRSEWGKLEAESLPPSFPNYFPSELEVVVVEDEGKIVARMFVMRLTHLEGAWIHPEYKHATTHLLRKTFEVAQRWPDKWVLGGAEDEQMRGIIERLGGIRWPGDFYVLGG